MTKKESKGFFGKLFGKKENESNKKEVVFSPIKGQVKPLQEVKDAAFASGVLGQGVAIIPTEGKVVAPFDGKIMTLFPTKHAVGIVSDNGCEVLIHIGMDTVQLDGNYFEAHIKDGDKITKGQTLVTFEMDKIKEAGFSLETPVVITNYDNYENIETVQDQEINLNEELITVCAK